MTVDIEKDAKEILAKAKAERESLSKKPEAKGAGSASPAEIKKTEGEKEQKLEAEKAEAVKQALAKDKEDEVILSKKEEELDDNQKKRKVELLKVKEAQEDKEKKSNVQKRIDELSGQIKSLENDRNSTKAERDALKTELDDIKKQLHQTPEDKTKEKVKKEMSARIVKYLDEDKELPREDRREMTEEELEEWLMEKPAQAQDWIAGRRIRRFREEEFYKRDESLNLEASKVMDRFNKGYVEQIAKHPELDVSKRKAELEKEGKSKQEVRKILDSENPKWKKFMEIFESDMEKYLQDEDGPQKIAELMEKGKPEEKNAKVEELEKQLADLKAENERLSGLDTEVSSTRHAEPKVSEPEIVKKTEELGASVGLSKDQVKRALERRKGGR